MSLHRVRYNQYMWPRHSDSRLQSFLLLLCRIFKSSSTQENLGRKKHLILLMYLLWLFVNSSTITTISSIECGPFNFFFHHSTLRILNSFVLSLLLPHWLILPVLIIKNKKAIRSFLLLLCRFFKSLPITHNFNLKFMKILGGISIWFYSGPCCGWTWGCSTECGPFVVFAS